MRIVSWNVKMGAHKKFDPLLTLLPDIAVLPECAHPDILRKKAPNIRITDSSWQGRSEHKGLAVLSFGDWKLERDPLFDPQFEMFLPIRVSGPADLRLLAVWAFNHRSKAFPQRKQHATRRAVEHYKPFLCQDPAFVIGDFNNNVIWDDRYPRFKYVLDELEDIGLVSAYHTLRSEPHGRELAPTFRHSSGRTYHIDYMFVPACGVGRIQEFDVGTLGDWKKLSDHSPVVMEITLGGAPGKG